MKNVRTHIGARRLYAATFGLARASQAPRLDIERVRELVERLPDRREALAVELRYGLRGRRHTLVEMGKKLPRSDGGVGVSHEIARQILARGMAKLRHPTRRAAWEEAVLK